MRPAETRRPRHLHRVSCIPSPASCLPTLALSVNRRDEQALEVGWPEWARIARRAWIAHGQRDELIELRLVDSELTECIGYRDRLPQFHHPSHDAVEARLFMPEVPSEPHHLL